MTKIHHLPSRDERYNAASLWIEKLDEGLSVEETDALQAWMAADSENHKLLTKMAGLWDRMDSLSRLSSLFPEPAVRRPRRNWLRIGLPIAASVVLTIAAALWFGSGTDRAFDIRDAQQLARATETTYETAIGEHTTVPLADGTELVLNTNSRVRIEYTPAHRLLVLEAGEVHVRVADDPSRPLTVMAGDRLVQAVGTVFNVEITDDQRVEVVVTEGMVRIGVQAPAVSNSPSAVPEVLVDSSMVLAAGEEIVLGGKDEAIMPVSDADIEVKLSWRRGNLIFRGESLEQAMTEVGRYTAVEFVIIDEDLKQVRIAGLFKAGDVDGMLAVLRENFDIAHERVNEKRVLLTAM